MTSTYVDMPSHEFADQRERKPYRIVMTTTQGARYTLDDEGAVVARSNGPEGFDYSGEWIIVGFLTRHNSRFVIPLERALNGYDIGHGYVVDNDHGTQRVWFGSPGRCKSLRREAA